MAKKKKKMTPAQAAAARRDEAKPKRKPLPDYVKDSGPRDGNSKMIIMVTAISIAVALALAATYLLPGMFGQ